MTKRIRVTVDLCLRRTAAVLDKLERDAKDVERWVLRRWPRTWDPAVRLALLLLLDVSTLYYLAVLAVNVLVSWAGAKNAEALRASAGTDKT